MAHYIGGDAGYALLSNFPSVHIPSHQRPTLFFSLVRDLLAEMSQSVSPRQTPGSPHFEDASMNPEFGVPTLPMEKLFHAISDLIVQVNQTNQALLG